MSFAVAIGMQNIKCPDGAHSYTCRTQANEEIRETPEDGGDSEQSLHLRPLPPALLRLGPQCPRGLQRTKAQCARPAHHQKDSVFSFLFSGSGKCWILEGNNLPSQAKLKRPRLWNLRIPSLVLPCSSWNLGGETQYFVTLFLSFTHHNVSAADYKVVIELSSNCQELRENKLANDILLLTWKKTTNF